MAVVPWTYNNVAVNRKDAESQKFLFQGHLLEILQDTQADVDVTKNTGLKLWDGAYLLAKYLENVDDFPKGFWNGKKCIELGAGCGLVGTVAWLLGADSCITDMENTMDHTAKCVRVNTTRIAPVDDNTHDIARIRTSSYEWGTKPKYLDPPFDLILGSDIVYHPNAVDSLIESINWLSGNHTTTILAYKPRGLGEHIFFDKLAKLNFQTNIVPRESHPIEFKGSDYEIYSFKKTV